MEFERFLPLSALCLAASGRACALPLDLTRDSLLSAGADGILLGAETQRGLYAVHTVQVVQRISAEV